MLKAIAFEHGNQNSNQDLLLDLPLEDIKPIPSISSARPASTRRSSSQSARSATTESDTSTNSRKRKEIISYLLDIPVVAVGIFIIGLGLALGLLIFFILWASEKEQIQQNLNFQSDQLMGLLNDHIEDLNKITATVQAYMGDALVGNPNKVSQQQFSQFLSAARLAESGFVLSVEYLQKVKREDLPDFNVELNQWYSDTAFSNTTFQVFDVRNSNGSFTLNNRPIYYPVKLMYPLDATSVKSVGYDPNSTPIRAEAMNKAIETADIAATQTVNLQRSGSQPINAFFLFGPIYNSSDASELLGFTRVTIESSSVLTKLQSTVVQASLLDFKSNIVVASTLTSYDLNYVKVQNTTVGFRDWRVTFHASNALVTQIVASNVGKWIGLVAPIVFSFLIFGILIAILIFKRLHLNKAKQKLLHEKIGMMKENKNQMDGLLDKVALEEQKARFILRAIPYPIFTVNQKGIIKHVNEAFSEQFYLELHNNPTISKVMPMFETVDQLEEFLEKKKEEVEEDQSNAIPTIQLVNKFNISHKFNLLVSKELFDQNKTKEELYIVLLQHFDLQQVFKTHSRNKSTSMFSYSQQQLIDNSRIRQILADKVLLEQFKQFCAEEKNEEGVLFLEDVAKFKQRTKVSSRVELQEEIKRKYLVAEAPKELNLPRHLLDQKVNQMQTGKVDDFDQLELLVMNILTQDSLNRFLAKLAKQ